MYIKTLTAEDFRNYERAQIELCPTTNVFYGNNAQGKTNLLEAVYLFSHGRSHRAHSDSELIRFGQSAYNLKLSFCDSSRDYTSQIRYTTEKKKQIKINNVPITKLSMLMSYFNAVMFSPEDLDLIKGTPSARRRFTDAAISQLYPKYLSNLINYQKTLIQKNSLLKTLKYSSAQSDATLSVWNDRLAEYGFQVYTYRKAFLEKILDLAQPLHYDISKEEFNIIYQPGIKIQNPEDFSKNDFFNTLEQNQKREIELAASQIGIQRDDFRVFINGNEARVYGSQGQQRTCVLTLKMAETEYINFVRGEFPVLLLDDIMSELDINRRRYLWERITDKQVLLTCTDTDILKSTDNTKLFHISKGTVG